MTSLLSEDIVKPPPAKEVVIDRLPPKRTGPFVGTAGWSISHEQKKHFPQMGTHLERYAKCFSAVEINSSFYRPHRRTTYARWAASVPFGFRFSVKVPKAITHAARLKNCRDLLIKFLSEAEGLETKLGCLLVQLPPSLIFEQRVARKFFQVMRTATDVPIAIEPRHATWFLPSAEAVLQEFAISRVAADPALLPEAAAPGGWPELIYYRLHGSPRIYHSAYSAAFIKKLGQNLETASRTSWCIFDNTASGAAMPDGRRLLAKINRL